MSFKNIKAGDRVTYLRPNGIGRNGVEFKKAVGTAQMLLIFEDHVVLNVGGRYGTPAVVNADNFVSVRSKS